MKDSNIETNDLSSFERFLLVMLFGGLPILILMAMFFSTPTDSKPIPHHFSGLEKVQKMYP